MYTIEKTLGLPIRLSAKWEEIKDGTVSLEFLFANYRRVVVILKHSMQPDPIYIDLDQFRAESAHYANTLSVFIAAKGPDYVYETITSLPDSHVGYLRYNHAVAAGYHLHLGKAGVNLPSDAPIEMKTDLKLTRPGEETIFQSLYDNCLFSVNGLLHRSDFDGNNVFIKDAGTSVHIAMDNQVGIYSFRDVAPMKTIGITEEMISIPDGYSSLKERIAITLPEEVSVKSFFFVIGGYLVEPKQGSCWQGSDRVIYLDINTLSMLDRVCESRKLINLKPLELTPNSANAEAIDVTELHSDRVIKKWLTLSQSYIVLLDTDNLFFDRCYVRQMRLPGMFTAYNRPEYPLVLDQGRFGEYWRQQEDDHWSITLRDSFRRNYQHRNEFVGQLKAVDGAFAFNMPFSFSQAYLLEVGAYQNS